MLETSWAQSIRFPWSSYAHDPQHDALAPVASQPLNRILWQTSRDHERVATLARQALATFASDPHATREHDELAQWMAARHLR